MSKTESHIRSQLLSSYDINIYRAINMSYVLFWDVLWRVKFSCQRFGTLCLFHLQRRVGVKCDSGSCYLLPPLPRYQSVPHPVPHHRFLNRYQTSYPLAYENGTDRVLKNVGNLTSY